MQGMDRLAKLYDKSHHHPVFQIFPPRSAPCIPRPVGVRSQDFSDFEQAQTTGSALTRPRLTLAHRGSGTQPARAFWGTTGRAPTLSIRRRWRRTLPPMPTWDGLRLLPDHVVAPLLRALMSIPRRPESRLILVSAGMSKSTLRCQAG